MVPSHIRDCLFDESNLLVDTFLVYVVAQLSFRLGSIFPFLDINIYQ